MAGCLIKDGVVADSNKLGGLSLIQCRDHLPKSHTINDHLVPAGSVNMGTYRLKDLADPTDAQDIATKAYVDGIVTPTPASIPMIAWPTSITKCTVAGLKVFTDLGINALMCYDHWWEEGFTDNPAYIIQLGQYFDKAAAAGVKLYIFMDNRTGSAATGNTVSPDDKTFIELFKDKPALAGWFIADEPHCWSDWGGYTIPEGDKKYYPYLTHWSWPAGGHNLALMLYEMIRGQDNDIANHPAFAVWDKGFMHLCSPPNWTDTYQTIYTPGGEILDVGSVDIYPNGDNWVFLDHWINFSHTFPYGNGDGFGELGKGMIPVIDAWTEGAAGILDNLVNQCLHWEIKYPTLKGIGFYTPDTWLVDNVRGENLREQIKDVCRRYGWGG